VTTYASGKKMSRISFEHDNKIVDDFKTILFNQGKSIASVLRPHVKKYVKDNKGDL